MILVVAIINPESRPYLDVEGYEVPEECAACDGTGYVTATPDSVTWIVRPTCADDPRAIECKHDGLEEWR